MVFSGRPSTACHACRPARRKVGFLYQLMINTKLFINHDQYQALNH